MTAADGGIVVEGAYRLRGPDFRVAGAWWRGVRHRAEAMRGLTAQEDLWYAGSFHAEPRDQPFGMRECNLRDVDGNYLLVGQELVANP